MCGMTEFTEEFAEEFAEDKMNYNFIECANNCLDCSRIISCPLLSTSDEEEDTLEWL